MSGDHNMYQKTKSYLDDFECPRCGHCCQALEEKREPLYWSVADGWVYDDDTSQKRVDEKAKREQEPVAWITNGGKGELWWHRSSKFDEEGNLIGPNPDDIPLYTAPPKREWVGLTGEEISAVDWKPNETLHDYARHIELKLRGKNT